MCSARIVVKVAGMCWVIRIGWRMTPPFRCDSTSNSACGPPVDTADRDDVGRSRTAGIGRNTTAAGSIDRGRAVELTAGGRSVRRPGLVARSRAPGRNGQCLDLADQFPLEVVGCPSSRVEDGLVT